jgi:hypothetical protein
VNEEALDHWGLSSQLKKTKMVHGKIRIILRCMKIFECLRNIRRPYTYLATVHTTRVSTGGINRDPKSTPIADNAVK